MEGLCFILFELMEGDSRSFPRKGPSEASSPTHCRLATYTFHNTSQIEQAVKTLLHLDICSFQNDTCEKIERYPSHIIVFRYTKKHVKRCVYGNMLNLGISHPRCQWKMPVRFRILKLNRLRRCASSEAQLQKLQVGCPHRWISPETEES